MSTAYPLRVPRLRVPSPPPPARGVLHLVWDGFDLLAWAEIRPKGPLPPLPWSDPAPSHPFAADSAALAEMLRLPRLGRLPARRLVLQLPSRPSGWPQPGLDHPVPVPSPQFGGPTAENFPCHSFAVPVLPIPRTEIAPLLFSPQADGVTRNPGRFPTRTAPGDVLLGGDARYWRRLAHLALAMCARGAFVPGTADRRGLPLATWLPAPNSEDRRMLMDLAAHMPQACRAACPDRAAVDLVRSLFELCVDFGVRTALGAHRQRLGRMLHGAGPAERWMLGLLHDNPLPLAHSADQALRAAIEGWAAEALLGSTPSVRLILRLEDPVPEGLEDPRPALRAEAAVAAAIWPLSVLVQTHDTDGVPGAIHPLCALFGGPGHPPEDADSLRLASLGVLRAAARVCAPLVSVLNAPAEPVLALSPQEAVALAESAGDDLRRAGADLVVPSWWRPTSGQPSARLHLEEGPVHRTVTGGSLSLGELVTFRWEAAIDGEPLRPEEFEALVRSRQPLVRLRTGWVRVDPEALRRVAEEWEETGGAGRLPGLGALRLALEVRQAASGGGPDGAGTAAVPAPVTVEAAGAMAERIERFGRSRRLEPLGAPSGFRGTLRPYQREGLGWLALLAETGLGGCLAADMGLGKTVQILALLQHRRVEGLATGPSLLVCPTSILGNWQAEQRRFVPDLVVHLHYGSGRPRGAALRQMAAISDVVLTSYALVARDREDLAAIAWDGVVLDEAQNVKNAVALQAQAARSLRAGYRFALTGTPVENGLSDLWSIFAFVLPGYLGGGRTFTREYVTAVGGGDAAAAARLRRVIAPFVLRRTKRDPAVAGELPEKIDMRQDCPLSTEQAALYTAVVRQSLTRIEGAEGLRRKAEVLTTLLRLKQICAHPSLFLGDGGSLEGRSGKLARLEALLEDVRGAGDRALIFTQFAGWARRLAGYLAERLECPAYCLDGSVPGTARAEMVAAFQEGDGPALFVLSLRAGGVGLNLTAAQHVFHYDRWWNPAVEAQATDRAHRIGQRRTVQVHRLIAPGTLEERIDAVIARKAAVAAQVVGGGAGEAWLTELSTAALRDILALRARGEQGA